MSNYQYGTEESYQMLVEAGMPKHPRLRYSKGNATIHSARLMAASSGAGITQSKIHPKDSRDVLSMHALRWIVQLRDADGIAVIQDLRLFDEPVDADDVDPAMEANMNIDGSSTVRGKTDMLDTIVEAVKLFVRHQGA